MEGGQLSGELQCVGTLEVTQPNPVGFICGTLPVPTDEAYRLSRSALVPSAHTVSAPRYRMLPTETDLNTPPLLSGDLLWESSPISQTLVRKCEALAVSGIAKYGDEIDVVAPTDILKQIFKIPYSKARVSVAVQRVGQTLILNTGPDVDEGEKLVRRQSSQTKTGDQSLFLNFAMHSVRAEACDCPPSHVPLGSQPNTSVLPGHFGSREDSFVSSSHPTQAGSSQFLDEIAEGNFCWGGNKKKKQSSRRDALKKTSDKPHGPVKESDKYRRFGNDGFLRVLFWQFHNFRMLLGSDLLLFSNEKYVAVSLHLWDVARQVTPLTWLEAWLDNMMASVPELAICYHQDGVVQGYELLKTDDIFLLKGVSDDGTPAFHPQVVQQNGLSVLRFLQDNCKQDPGAYWLYKSAGEDVIQLFDLSVVPKSHSSGTDDKGSSLLSVMNRGRRDSLFSLGTLLYRLAHRLSLSKTSSKRARCGEILRKCLNFLDGQDHLVVRAHVHEQFARLILKCYEELDLTSESFLLESEVTVTDLEDEPLSFTQEKIGKAPQDEISSPVSENSFLANDGNMGKDTMVKVSTKETISLDSNKDNLVVCHVSESSNQVVRTVSDPISSKLAAIHHVSQAIKSLRWKRQLQDMEGEPFEHRNKTEDRTYAKFSICGCGDPDCIEGCDIRDWLASSKMDHKLWKLVLLLGESYLALGQAYKEDEQLRKALKVVDLACSVYGSVPQHIDNAYFISSMACNASSQLKLSARRKSLLNSSHKLDSTSIEERVTVDQISSNYLFWAKAWTLVGDVYVEYHILSGKEIVRETEDKSLGSELRVPSEVTKEVKRLKKKLGQNKQICSLCSLVNCSCQSDRASSGNSASSSVNVDAFTVGRKHAKKAHARPLQPSGSSKGSHGAPKVENVSGSVGNEHSHRSQPEMDKPEGSLESKGSSPQMSIHSETDTQDTPKEKRGGIFRFLGGPIIGDAEYTLSGAISCYDAARNATHGLPAGSEEVESVLKKKGWACNELGRNRLENQGLKSAEVAFIDAIKTFKEVSDHANIILINCNLGHGRRTLAESMVSKIEICRKDGPWPDVYKQAVETAKYEYSASLRYYNAARSELHAAVDRHVSISSTMWNEVNTQVAHTYLRLGMLLAKENVSAEVYENVNIESLPSIPSIDRPKKELMRCEISANEAIREALCTYESLGDLRKQEAAYAYFQLACYHRDCCLRYLNFDKKQINSPKKESINMQKVKRYASLADRNWQKSMDFYGPQSHPTMHLTIVMERSALSFELFSSFHNHTMLESALSYLLEARYVDEETAQLAGMMEKFWNQLQVLLKSMLSITLSGNANKTSACSLATSTTNSDIGKLRELYRMSLKSASLSQLQAMHALWSS